MNADLLQPARVGVQNLELEPRGVAHELAAHGNTPEKPEQEPAERVDIPQIGRASCRERV